MKRLLHQFSRTIAALTLAAVAATLAASPATAQLSALRGAPRTADPVVPPAHEAAPTVSPLAGAWLGTFESPEQRTTFQMVIFPDGSYKARVVIEGPPASQPNVAMFAGKWSIEGRELVLVNDADGSTEKSEIELQGDELTMKGIGPNGSNMSLKRVQLNPAPVGPNTPVGPGPQPLGPGSNVPGPGPNPPGFTGFGPRGPVNPNTFAPNPIPTPQPGPVGPAPSPVGPAPAPVVGTWYGFGPVGDSQMDCKVLIMPNGTYQSEINVRNGKMNSQFSEQGTWKIRGRKIVFETDEESSYIPYKVEDGVLILDYSEEVGIVAILSPTPGQGQIRVVDDGFDY